MSGLRPDHRHRAMPCPACGAMLDAAQQETGKPHAPVPGDLSICAYCAAPLVYGADEFAVLNPKDCTPEELTAVSRARREVVRRLDERRRAGGRN